MIFMHEKTIIYNCVLFHCDFWSGKSNSMFLLLIINNSVHLYPLYDIYNPQKYIDIMNRFFRIFLILMNIHYFQTIKYFT